MLCFFFLNEDIRAVSVSHPYSLRWHNQPAWQAAVIVNKRYVRNCYMISDWTCWPRESWPWVTFNLWNMVYWLRIVNDRQISYAQAWAIISTHTYTHIAITHTNSRRTIHTNSRANTAIIFFSPWTHAWWMDTSSGKVNHPWLRGFRFNAGVEGMCYRAI